MRTQSGCDVTVSQENADNTHRQHLDAMAPGPGAGGTQLAWTGRCPRCICLAVLAAVHQACQLHDVQPNCNPVSSYRLQVD